jgi:antitoxin HicB
MKLCFPVEFKEYSNRTVGAFFPDVPEAITCGSNREEALQHAEDALTVALSGYLDERRKIPTPRVPRKGQAVIWLHARLAFKVAVHNAMVSQGVTQAQLGERLGIEGRQVRRILDLDHESRLEQLVAALAALGLRATIGVEPADRPPFRLPATKAA